MIAADTATVSAGLLGSGFQRSAKNRKGEKNDPGVSHEETQQFLISSCAEILETDLWVQYNELGGIQDNEVPGGSGSALCTAKLQKLDMDIPQYIHDNTEDEFTHFTFNHIGSPRNAATKKGCVSCANEVIPRAFADSSPSAAPFGQREARDPSRGCGRRHIHPTCRRCLLLAVVDHEARAGFSGS
jgi:hypothetical protein